MPNLRDAVVMASITFSLRCRQNRRPLFFVTVRAHSSPSSMMSSNSARPTSMRSRCEKCDHAVPGGSRLLRLVTAERMSLVYERCMRVHSSQYSAKSS